jgi:hypothetical protein
MAENQPNLNQTRQDIKDIAAVTEETFRSVAANIQDMFANALNASDTVIKSFQKDISNSIKSAARESSKLADNFEKMNQGALKQADIQKQIEARAAKLRAIEVSTAALRRIGTAEAISQANELNKQYQDLVSINQSYTEELSNQVRILDEVDKEIGLLGGALGGIGTLMKNLGLTSISKPINDAIENTKKYKIQQKTTQNEIKLNQENINKLNSRNLSDAQLKAGFGGKELKSLVSQKEALKDQNKELGAQTSKYKNVASSLKEQLTYTNLMDFGIAQLVQAFLKLDTSIGNTAKSMGISYKQATQLSQQFNNIANSSGNIFVTTEGISESFNQINSALGTNANLNEELLLTQTELTKQAFYSVEAATQISKLSLATGKPAKEVTTAFLGQAKALNLVNNTAINEKQLLESISKTSKGTLATFAAQPGKLAEAAYQAKKVGLELESMKGIQDSLLNIESSIAAEFEAEVLTGKQLNLERARYYALTNNISGLSQELGKQGIDQVKFAGMNVLQQEAIAQAMGLSRDQLGGMLLEQAAISKLSQIDGKTAKEKYDNAVKLYGVEKANAMLGDETLANQMASASMQDRFNASVEKLKEIFTSLVEPLMPVLDIFVSILKIVGVVMKVLNPLIQSLNVVGNFVADVLSGNNLNIDFTNTKNAFDRQGESIKNDWGIEDGIAPPGTGPFSITDRNGNTTITAANDGLAVSPNINTVRPAGVVQQAPPSPVAMIDYEKLAQVMSKVTVQSNLDGVAVSSRLQTPMGIATRKI